MMKKQLQRFTAAARRLHWPAALRLRPHERRAASCVLLLTAALNALLIYKYWDRFLPGGKLGFYSIFMKHFHVSGFDGTSYIALSCGDIYFNTLRHPLLYTLLWPLHCLDLWVMELTGKNAAVFIMAVVQTLCATASFVLLGRILTDCVRLAWREALPLTALLFSFAYIMLSTMVPDHFGLSLPLLLLTVLTAGRCMARGEAMRPVQQALLLFFTAGVTLTNGAKTCLAMLFTAGRRVLSWRSVLSVAVPLALLWGVRQWQYYACEVPQKQRIERMIEKKREKDPHFAEPNKKYDEWRESQNGRPLDKDNVLLQWSDMSTSRLRSVVENLLGESLQLHRDHLLGDVQNDRPVFVAYRTPLPYAIEAVVAALALVGVWCGRRERLMHMLLAWLACDLTIHLVFGFGLNEVYIMTAHWAFIVPIAAGYAVRRASGGVRRWAVRGVWALAVWLWLYNATLIAGYCMERA